MQHSNCLHELRILEESIKRQGYSYYKIISIEKSVIILYR